ncbi:hypothetical protein A2J03_09515 [Rhodococcus sp. EPR-157]|uniref:nucleotidyl transferase AbiEii/AbiGii toxin family protein n=1 Tax=Rhodococcus sp. EPR-157 TaxID=1813677 RepID=UPI0007BBA87F|nr:nucleotidyl transferase AbiEii/AbiGii toxin family protein [Rhodococcus sp. EPR-157]KZF01752.1 hypothetical protein A2J03_09515 [Rhodococcus sp. EPR-157]
MNDAGAGVLTAFQVRVARLFFSLPASEGFFLAGGAALVAQSLTTRPTQDLDFFTSSAGGPVRTARDALEAAAAQRNWRVERIQDAETFCRLLIHGDEELLVDLALDSVPGMTPTASVVGPTFAPEELAGRKLDALFDRAEARDFVDVYALRTWSYRVALLSRAAEVDRGFFGLDRVNVIACSPLALSAVTADSPKSFSIRLFSLVFSLAPVVMNTPKLAILGS